MHVQVGTADFLKFTGYLILATAGLRLIAGHLSNSDNETAHNIGVALAGVTP